MKMPAILRRTTVVVSTIALSAVGIAGASTSQADTNFTFHAPTLNGAVFATAASADGRTVIGGGFSTVNGAQVNGLAVLNADGSLDQDFLRAITSGGNVGFDGPVYSVVPTPSGFLVGGSFTQLKGQPVGRVVNLVRSNTGWLASNSFGTGFDGVVRALAITGVRTVVAVGGFTTYQGQAAAGIAEFDLYNGAFGSAFGSNVGAGLSGVGKAVYVQENGQILVGGTFTHASSASRSQLARYLASGALDTSFSPAVAGGVGPEVTTITTFPSGRIVVGGTFSTVNGATHNNIAIISPDGSLPSLSVNPSANGAVWSAVRQIGGCVIVAGAFTQMNSFPVGGISKLLDNGFGRGPFNVGSGAHAGYISSLASAPDGEVVIGGAFDSFDGLPLAGSIVRITDSPANPIPLVVTLGNGRVTITWQLPITQTGGSPLADIYSGWWAVSSSNQGSCDVVLTSPSRATTTCSGMKNGAHHIVDLTVVNQAGYANEDGSLTVIPRTTPSGVRSPMTTFPAAKKAKLSWTVPASNGGASITAYLYCLKACTKSINWKSTGGSPARTYVTLTGLTKGAKYTVRVRAKNAAGTGPAVLVLFTQAK